MAEEKKVKKDHVKWFREMRSELKKVVWPDRKTVMKNGKSIQCAVFRDISKRSQEVQTRVNQKKIQVR